MMCQWRAVFVAEQHYASVFKCSVLITFPGTGVRMPSHVTVIGILMRSVSNSSPIW